MPGMSVGKALRTNILNFGGTARKDCQQAEHLYPHILSEKKDKAQSSSSEMTTSRVVLIEIKLQTVLHVHALEFS